MSIMLFKEGDSHLFRGIPCQILRVTPNKVDEAKLDGWSDTVPGTKKKRAKKKVPEDVPWEDPEV